MRKLISLTTILLASALQTAQAAPIVHFTDFIPNASISQFNGFESIPNNGSLYTGGATPYTEDGITVQQVNGDSGNDIWVTYAYSSQHQGRYSWYPNGGDHGYTQISLSSGVDFGDVGFLLGSGFGTSNTVLYELLNNGSVVLSGSYAPSGNFLGFAGGGFDTIRVADSAVRGYTGTVTDGHYQALALDSIKVGGNSVVSNSVPEPGSLALLLAGLAGFGWHRRKLQA